VKRFAIKAAFDIVWMVAIIFCANVFIRSISSFVISMGGLLVAKWIADAVLAKMLYPKALPAEPPTKPIGPTF
jgi:hypothetical protein